MKNLFNFIILILILLVLILLGSIFFGDKNYNLRDNCNSYILKEEGNYVKKELMSGKKFDLFKEFYNMKKNNLEGSIIL